MSVVTAQEARMTMPARAELQAREWRWWHMLAVDLRSLALFRMAMGSVLLFNLVGLLGELDDFFSDRGVLPRDVLLSQFSDPWAFSVHLMSGQWAVQLVIFFVAIVFAIALILGYRTRLSTIVSWFLLCSMQVRNPFILHGGDDLLRLLLFWSMFAPLGSALSLDRALNPNAPKPDPLHLSFGSLALMLQLCVMYLMTAVLKFAPEWRTEGSAIYYALSLDQFATGFGRALLQFPWLCRTLTFATVVFEFLGPILAFCPAVGGGVRLLMVVLFIGFHTGLGLTLYLGIFPWICAAAWLMFVPSVAWEVAEEALADDADRGMVMFFDGKCGFCRRVVQVLRGLLRLRHTTLREAQSDPEMNALMWKRTAWIVRDPEGGVHTGYDAFVALCRRSALARRIANVLGSVWARRVGERAYRAVADNRARAAQVLRALTPPPPRERLARVVAAFAGLSFAFVFLCNVAIFQPARFPGSMAWWSRLGSLTQLFQAWAMFAPYPSKNGGWYVFEGIKADSTRVDVWNGGASTDAKPADVASTYRDSQWRKYLINLWYARFNRHRPHFARYLCRTWNERHEAKDRVHAIRMSFMLEVTPPPGQPHAPPNKDWMWEGACADSLPVPTQAAAASH
jgi:predicted DCC family thiol-disulfide oxidoreductase YuxK